MVVGGFYQLIAITTIDFTSDEVQNQTLTQNQTLNAEESQLEVSGGSIDFSFNMTIGLITIMVSSIVAGLIGIKVLGSGLDPQAVKIIWNGLIYYGLWAIFSVLGYTAFILIPFGFGLFGWFLLTAIYSLGVWERMGS